MSANKVIKDEIEHWSIEDVGLWISEVCKRNQVTDYRSSFIAKGVSGEMLLKLTAKELEEFLEIKALADVKALENNINALRTAVQLSEHQLGRSDHNMNNHMPDNSQIAMSGHQYPLDASGSSAEHLQHHPSGHDSHAHNDNGDHESKSEQYGEFKEEDFVCRWDNCINQSNFAVKFGNAAELALHVAEHVLSNPIQQLNQTCLACGRSFIGMTDEQITAHFKTPSHSFVPQSFNLPQGAPMQMPNKPVGMMLPPMPVQMHDHQGHHHGGMEPNPWNQFMPHDHEMQGHEVGPKRRVRSKKRKAEEMEPASMEDSMDDLRRYLCDITGCGKTFKRSGHLKRHKLVHAPATERERYPCTQASCSKTYSTKYDLAAHVRQVHQGAPQFKCSYKGCCRRFVRKESLEKHLQTFDHSKASTKIEEGQIEEEGDDDIADGSMSLASMSGLSTHPHEHAHNNNYNVGHNNNDVPMMNPHGGLGMPDQQAENLMYLQNGTLKQENNNNLRGDNAPHIKNEMSEHL